MFVEPAVMHMWKTSQKLMLQQLVEQDKVIIGGDMRADSPGINEQAYIYTFFSIIKYE